MKSKLVTIVWTSNIYMRQKKSKWWTSEIFDLFFNVNCLKNSLNVNK